MRNFVVARYGRMGVCVSVSSLPVGVLAVLGEPRVPLVLPIGGAGGRCFPACNGTRSLNGSPAHEPAPRSTYQQHHSALIPRHLERLLLLYTLALSTKLYLVWFIMEHSKLGKRL